MPENRSDKFFFPPISWGGWVYDNPNEGLAKFGYMLERKVEQVRNPATCWVPLLWSCHLIMDLWSHGSIFPHNVMTWTHPLPKKNPFLPFLLFFSVARMRNLAPRNITWWFNRYSSFNQQMGEWNILGTYPRAFFVFWGVSFSLSSQLVWNLVVFFLMSKFCPQYC